MKRLTCALALAFLIAAPIRAQQTVETVSAWDPNDLAAFTLGPGSGANWASAVGQTFMAPSYPSLLTGFSLYLANFDDTFFPNIDFYAYVMGWDNTALSATGPVLYKSGLRTANAASFPWQRQDFNFSGLPLALSSSYVFFVSTHETGSLVDATQLTGLVTTDAYTGGSALSMAEDPFRGTSAWQLDPTTDVWAPGATDLAFELRFQQLPNTTVPEPGSILLLATGLLGLGMARRRKALSAQE